MSIEKEGREVKEEEAEKRPSRPKKKTPGATPAA
jgi:hypothetical protein